MRRKRSRLTRMRTFWSISRSRSPLALRCFDTGGDADPDGIEVDATAEGVDPEIVSIFIEEAHELLDAMGELLARARAQPTDWADLTTLRRSYHTLKGSGRMAGLHAIGDAAWTIESLLNQWLDAERPASEDLIRLAALGRDLFSGWIADVAQRGRTVVRTAHLSAEADRIAQELAGPVDDTGRTAGPGWCGYRSHGFPGHDNCGAHRRVPARRGHVRGLDASCSALPNLR